MKDKLTVLVNTCDKYEFLWNDFKELYDKNFPNDLNLEVCLLSQTKTSPLFDRCFTPGPIQFSNAVEYALERIETPYILWLQDDYFFTDKVAPGEIYRYIDLCDKYNADRLAVCSHARSLYNYYKIPYEDNLFKFHEQSDYTLSLQASIFRKDFLLDVLKGESWSPWQSEIDGTRKINTQGKSINIYMCERRFYEEAMHKGQPTDFYKKFLNKKNEPF
jgi:hypothetical protein